MTVSESLNQEGKLELVGGIGYLSIWLQRYLYGKRRVLCMCGGKIDPSPAIREANQIIERSYAAADDATAILDQAERSILEVAQRRRTRLSSYSRCADQSL